MPKNAGENEKIDLPFTPLIPNKSPHFLQVGAFPAVIKQKDEAYAPSVCFEKREREKMKKIGIRQGPVGVRLSLPCLKYARQTLNLT
mgnify:CR=1 FL=1